MKTPTDMLLDSVEWREVTDSEPGYTDGLPYLTHEGIFKIGDLSIRCYQLDNGQRIMNADDVEAAFGMVPNVKYPPIKNLIFYQDRLIRFFAWVNLAFNQ